MIPSDPQSRAARQAFLQIARRSLDIRRALLDRILQAPPREMRFLSQIYGEIGAIGFPLVFQRLLQTSASPLRIRLIYTLGAIGPSAAASLPTFLPWLEADPALRFVIIHTIGKFRERAAPAIPALIRLLRIETILHYAIITALGRIGKPAIPALLELLQENDPTLSASVCEAFGAMGAEAEAAIPALILRLAASQRDLRLAAAVALGKIGSPALPHLRQTLISSHSVLWRTNAAYALAMMGPLAAPALPELRLTLRDPAWQIRRTSAFALEKIGKPALPALSDLLRLSRDPNHHVRYFGLRALQAIGTPQKTFRSALLSAFPLPFPEGAIFLSKSLQSVGLIDKAFDSLYRLIVTGHFATEHAKLFRQVEELLPHLLPYTRTLIQLLQQKSLFDKDPYMDKRIAWLIRKIGYSAFPLLFEPLGANPPRWYLARLLFAISYFPRRMPEMQTVLASYQKHASAEIRLQAALALGSSRGRPDETIRYLVPFLSDPAPSVSFAALQGIASQRSVSPFALRIFAHALLTFPADGRHEAAKAILAWPSPPTLAFPALLTALRDPEASIRIPVLQALRRLGPAAKPALPWIAEALVDIFPEVVREAKATFAAVASASPGLVDLQIRYQTQALFTPWSSLVPSPTLQSFLSKLSLPPQERLAFLRSLLSASPPALPLLLLGLLSSPPDAQTPILHLLRSQEMALVPYAPALLLAYCRSPYPPHMAPLYARILRPLGAATTQAFLSLLDQPRKCRASALAHLLHALRPSYQALWPLFTPAFGSRSEIFPLSLFFKDSGASLDALTLAARHPLLAIRDGAIRSFALSSAPLHLRRSILLPALRDPSSRIRLRAVLSLPSLSLPTDELQSLLHAALSDESSKIVKAAALLLRSHSP